MRRTAALLAVALLAGCTAVTGSSVKVDYYSIGGNSIASIDDEIKRRGPRIGGRGHAVAVARIRIDPRYDAVASAARCTTRNVVVDVNARVTLPRWRNRSKASAELGAAWDNIDRYTRLHESVHVAIAFDAAKDLKRKIERLTAPDCESLRARVKTAVAARLARHDADQRRFDRDEQARIRKLAREQEGA